MPTYFNFKDFIQPRFLLLLIYCGVTDVALAMQTQDCLPYWHHKQTDDITARLHVSPRLLSLSQMVLTACPTWDYMSLQFKLKHCFIFAL